jgi:hypothetical protein
MTVNFTSPLSKKLAKAIVLKTDGTKSPLRAAGKNQQPVVAPGARIWKPGLEDDENDVSSVAFNGPFPENTKFIVELPAGLKDDAGRKLVNADQYPLAVRTGAYPSLAKFFGRFGILESNAEALLPVTVRNLEDSLDLSTLHADGTVSGKMANIKSDRGKDIQAWLRKVATTSRTKSIFTTGPKIKKFSVPRPNGAKAFEVIGIPLGQPGFYVVELESRILGKALLNKGQPMYVQTTALLTNLAAHFKKGRESSLVWVTTWTKRSR